MFVFAEHKLFAHCVLAGFRLNCIVGEDRLNALAKVSEVLLIIVYHAVCRFSSQIYQKDNTNKGQVIDWLVAYARCCTKRDSISLR